MYAFSLMMLVSFVIAAPVLTKLPTIKGAPLDLSENSMTAPIISETVSHHEGAGPNAGNSSFSTKWR